MAAQSSKVVSALHANWWINLAGLLLSFCANVVLVRAMPAMLYAEYGAVIAMMGLAMLVFEAGANSGLTRYLAEAEKLRARGTFYWKMQWRRWLAGGLCAAALIAFGPMYVRSTQLANLAGAPWMFLIIGAIVAVTLSRLLAHYGLIALFETKPALLIQQTVQIARSGTLAVIALCGGTLLHLVLALLGLTVMEALIVHRRLWRAIGGEQGELPAGFVNRSQTFGFITVFDKLCAMLGSGTVILLVLAPRQPAMVIALLTLAIDLVGKLIGLTVMPMGNLVAPYLSQTSDDLQAQGAATSRVVKLSSLLYCGSIGAGALALPAFVPAVYGGAYAAAAKLALVLLLPTAFENWVRGTCSPALLRLGRYRALVKVNVLQAVATLTTLWLVRNEPAHVLILSVGAVRCAVASINLVQLAPVLPRGTYLVPLQGAVTSLAAAVAGFGVSELLPAPPLLKGGVALAVFGIVFSVGARWLVARDSDTLRIAHRIVAGRLGFLARLLPPSPANA